MFVQMETANGPEWVNIMHVRRVSPVKPAGENGADKNCTLHFDDGSSLAVKQDGGETSAHMTGSVMGLLMALGTAMKEIAVEDAAKKEGSGDATPPDTDA